jgi:hypothetical protein
MSDDTIALLREIRDNQQAAPQLQRGQMALYLRQLDRVACINGRAEAIQGRAAKAVRFAPWIALPLVSMLLVLMLWPWLRPVAGGLSLS